MKNFVKFGLVGLAGYLIGFYEMKYKTMKILLDATTSREKQKEDGAQE